MPSRVHIRGRLDAGHDRIRHAAHVMRDGGPPHPPQRVGSDTASRSHVRYGIRRRFCRLSRLRRVAEPDRHMPPDGVTDAQSEQKAESKETDDKNENRDNDEYQCTHNALGGHGITVLSSNPTFSRLQLQ